MVGYTDMDGRIFLVGVTAEIIKLVFTMVAECWRPPNRSMTVSGKHTNEAAKEREYTKMDKPMKVSGGMTQNMATEYLHLGVELRVLATGCMDE